MQEMNVRKLHRRLGIVLAFFLLLQVISGLFFSVRNFSHHIIATGPQGYDGGTPWGNVMGTLHYGLGPVGDVYRVLLGLGLVVMAVSGAAIFLKIRSRTRQTKS